MSNINISHYGWSRRGVDGGSSGGVCVLGDFGITFNELIHLEIEIANS